MQFKLKSGNFLKFQTFTAKTKTEQKQKVKRKSLNSTPTHHTRSQLTLAIKKAKKKHPEFQVSRLKVSLRIYIFKSAQFKCI